MRISCCRCWHPQLAASIRKSKRIVVGGECWFVSGRWPWPWQAGRRTADRVLHATAGMMLTTVAPAVAAIDKFEELDCGLKVIADDIGWESVAGVADGAWRESCMDCGRSKTEVLVRVQEKKRTRLRESRRQGDPKRHCLPARQ
jgi:hypothetical protein